MTDSEPSAPADLASHADEAPCDANGGELPRRPRRDRVLVAWAKLVTARPLLTLVVCLALAAASAWLTMSRLEFRSDRSELVNPELPWQKRFLEMRRSFPTWDEPAIVVVDRGLTPESQAAGERFIAELAARLQADARFPRVMSGFLLDEAPPGLIFTRPLEEIESIATALGQTAPVVASPSLDALLGLSQFAGRSLGAEQAQGLTGLLERAAAAGEGRSRTVLGMDEPGAVQRFVTSSGRYGMILVSLSHVSSRNRAGRGVAENDAEEAIDTAGGAVRALREHIQAVRAMPGLGSVHAGVTGIPVLESDETKLSMRDATAAGVLSLAGITILLLIAYRGFVVPLLAVLSLLIGMAWSFAWATIAVGHLQLLSVTFASVLLGLGIDVAIHIIARLELVHPDHDHLSGAVAQAFRGVGPGIITASVTVAAAAGSMALTNFSGVAEMGLIAAGGILLCTASIMCALPAMLMLLPSPEKRLLSHDGGESRPFMGRLGVMFHRRPGPLLLVVGAVLAASCVLALGVRYDTDLMRLMPETTESVRWQNALQEDDARSVWHAVAQARSLEEARELTERLRRLEVVSDVEGAGLLFPDAEKVQRAQALLRSLPDPAAAPAEASLEGAEGASHVGALRRIAAALAGQHASTLPALAEAARALAGLPDAGLSTALETYRRDRARLLGRLASLRSAAPPTLEMLPGPLRELMVGTDGSVLLRIYPYTEESESALAPERLEAFASGVLEAAPRATGPSIQIYESTRLINRAYAQAGIWALVAIIVLLLIDFRPTVRGVGDTLCALFPVFAGAALLLALMWLADVSLNFANMIVMPLLVGIGVGSGVHVVRRWRLQPNDEPPGLAGGSGRAITLTTLTTVIGFASMMLAQHRGIRSLGFTMTVGLMMVWLVTIVALPAVLKLRGRGA